MTPLGFIIRLIVTCFCSVFLILLLTAFPNVKPFIDLGWISLMIFAPMSTLVYFLGKSTVFHPNRSKFISLTIGNMLLKMVVSVGLVSLYFKVKEPNHTSFLIPFLCIYLIFTIFETHFLMVLANQKKA